MNYHFNKLTYTIAIVLSERIYFLMPWRPRVGFNPIRARTRAPRSGSDKGFAKELIVPVEPAPERFLPLKELRLRPCGF